MDDFSHNISAIQSAISGYVKELNEIYMGSIFKFAPNERIYFSIGKWVQLKDFATHPDKPGMPCENAGIVLSEFSHVRKLSNTFLLLLFLTRSDIFRHLSITFSILFSGN